MQINPSWMCAWAGILWRFVNNRARIQWSSAAVSGNKSNNRDTVAVQLYNDDIDKEDQNHSELVVHVFRWIPIAQECLCMLGARKWKRIGALIAQPVWCGSERTLCNWLLQLRRDQRTTTTIEFSEVKPQQLTIDRWWRTSDRVEIKQSLSYCCTWIKSRSKRAWKNDLLEKCIVSSSRESHESE